MKRIILTLIIFIIFGLMIYMGISFYNLDINASHWSKDARFVFLFLIFIDVSCIRLIYLFSDKI